MLYQIQTVIEAVINPIINSIFDYKSKEYKYLDYKFLLIKCITQPMICFW